MHQAPPVPPHPPPGSAWRQLALPFAHTPHYTAVDFLLAPSNAAAQAWLARVPEWPEGRLALWGPEGSGKTHLLHIWAARCDATLLAGPTLPRVFVIPTRPLAIDDADAAAEQSLLHWLNAAAEAGMPVLLAGRTPPARWPTALPDLASRLRAAAAVEIGPAEDTLLRALLARLLAERQLAVSVAMQEWLLTRLPRTPAAIREAVARLDRLTLAGGRKLIRAAAAAVVADLAAEPERTDSDSSAVDVAAVSSAPRLLL